MIDNHYIAEAIKNQFGEKIRSVEESYGMYDIIVEKEIVLDVMKWLKEHAEFQFNFLTSLCGMNYPDRKDEELSVVYHMHSLPNNIRIRLHIFFPAANPKCKTATTLYSTANWMERETYDFFGIIFEGHPDLRRILNMDEMDYFPLLKKYPLEDATRTDKEDKYFGR
ncbi:MAG: NADH-quinone oxidoreductase subunit C [Chitinophagales bacterium]|nr:NADH-quinone oxidoreductase subunit C [Chitinophagales bacterium]